MACADCNTSGIDLCSCLSSSAAGSASSRPHPIAELLVCAPAVVVFLGRLSSQALNLRHFRVHLDLASVQAVCMQAGHLAHGPMLGTAATRVISMFAALHEHWWGDR